MRIAAPVQRALIARWSCVGVLLLSIAIVPGCGSKPAPPPAQAAGLARGNVLLITIDTLRTDHVGAYGSKRGATPTLDRLAAEGVRVEAAYAQVPLTLPSHTALLTGAYPFVNGVRDNGSFRFDGKRPT